MYELYLLMLEGRHLILILTHLLIPFLYQLHQVCIFRIIHELGFVLQIIQLVAWCSLSMKEFVLICVRKWGEWLMNVGKG